jgi:hypothetical protein
MKSKRHLQIGGTRKIRLDTKKGWPFGPTLDAPNCKINVHLISPFSKTKTYIEFNPKLKLDIEVRTQGTSSLKKNRKQEPDFALTPSAIH